MSTPGNGSGNVGTHNCCNACGCSLSGDEKALSLKLISRNTKVFYCLDCLGQRLGCSRSALEDRIRYYRESGNCVLFR